MVMKSILADLMSSITCITCSRVSPSPTMMPDLVNMFAVQFLHALEQAQRVEVARTRTNGQVERWHGLEIVVEHIRACRDNLFEGAFLLEEVRRQHLDRGAGRGGADGPDGAGEVPCAAVVQVIAIN